MLTRTTLIAATATIALSGPALAGEAKGPTVMDDQALASVVAGTSNRFEALTSVVEELQDSDALFLNTPNLCNPDNPCSESEAGVYRLTYGGDACAQAETCDKHPVFYTTIGGSDDVGSQGATPPTYAPADYVIEAVIDLF